MITILTTLLLASLTTARLASRVYREPCHAHRWGQ